MSEDTIDENRISKAMRQLNIHPKDARQAAAMLNLLVGRRKATRQRDYEPSARTLEEFFAFALPLVTNAQGQLFQDLWVLWELGGSKRNGYFVEFGATNGITMSNSHLLNVHYDWDGILAEPNPDYHERLARERSCNITHKCVYSKSNETFKFLCAEKGLMSRLAHINPNDHNEQSGKREIKQEIDVETISLNDLMDEYNAPSTIDYISVDTEGSEFEILSHFDFDKRHVRMFTVEHNFTDLREQIYDLMTSKGYVRRFPEYTRFDDWYIHMDDDQSQK